MLGEPDKVEVPEAPNRNEFAPDKIMLNVPERLDVSTWLELVSIESGILLLVNTAAGVDTTAGIDIDTKFEDPTSTDEIGLDDDATT